MYQIAPGTDTRNEKDGLPERSLEPNRQPWDEAWSRRMRVKHINKKCENYTALALSYLIGIPWLLYKLTGTGLQGPYYDLGPYDGNGVLMLDKHVECEM